MQLVKQNFQLEPTRTYCLGQAYLSLKGCIYKLDNAIALNNSEAIFHRRIELNESVRLYKIAKKNIIINSIYSSKLSSLGDDFLTIANSLLQISSSNPLSLMVLR